MREEINTNKVPKAVGPFSQAIIEDNFLFISGQLPIDVSDGKMKDSIEDQVHQCFKNATYICEEAGAKLKNAVKVTVLLDDIDNFLVVNEIYKTYFEEPYPARVAYEVSKLPLNSKIEIDFIIKR